MFDKSPSAEACDDTTAQFVGVHLGAESALTLAPTPLLQSLRSLQAGLNDGQRMAAGLPDVALLSALERRGAFDDIIFGLGARLWALTGEMTLAPHAGAYLHLGELLGLLRLQLALTPDSSVRFGERLSPGSPRAWWHNKGQCRAIVVLPANAIAVLAQPTSVAAPYLLEAAHSLHARWLAAIDDGAFAMADLGINAAEHASVAQQWLAQTLVQAGVAPAAVIDTRAQLHLGSQAREWRDNAQRSDIVDIGRHHGKRQRKAGRRA